MTCLTWTIRNFISCLFSPSVTRSSEGLDHVILNQMDAMDPEELWKALRKNIEKHHWNVSVLRYRIYMYMYIYIYIHIILTYLLGLTFHSMAQIFQTMGHLGSRCIYIYITYRWVCLQLSASKHPSIFHHQTPSKNANGYFKCFM